jgi:hypothetical protein
LSCFLTGLTDGLRSIWRWVPMTTVCAQPPAALPSFHPLADGHRGGGLADLAAMLEWMLLALSRRNSRKIAAAAGGARIEHPCRREPLSAWLRPQV